MSYIPDSIPHREVKADAVKRQPTGSIPMLETEPPLSGLLGPAGRDPGLAVACTLRPQIRRLNHQPRGPPDRRSYMAHGLGYGH